jgi:tetratricopeptide (TPR) repeat protein
MPAGGNLFGMGVLTSRMGNMRRLAGLLVALILVVWLCVRAAPPPAGAITALWQVAGELQALKSYAAAAEAYEQIASLTPGDPAPLLAIGSIYLARQRYPAAVDAFNRALARRMDYAPAWAGLAATAWEQHDLPQAIARWQMALMYQPDLMPARRGLALAYLERGWQAEAEATLRQGLASGVTGQPGDQQTVDEMASARLLLAMMLAVRDAEESRRQLAAIGAEASAPIQAQRDYLVDAFDRAEAADSAGEAARRLGLAFTQAEMWPLARMAFERALALDATDAEAMAFLGHAEAQLGWPAWEHLAGAIAARPDWPLGHYLFGLYLVKQNLLDLAVQEFQTTVRLDPGNVRAQLDLAHTYVSLGKYLAAEEAFKAAVAASPKDLTSHLALAHFYADCFWHVADGGLPAAQAATDLAPQDPQARDLLGWMYLLAGDVPSAQLQLLSALQLAPDQASTYYHLGVLYKTLGWQEMARFAFLRAVELTEDAWVRDRAQAALGSLQAS